MLYRAPACLLVRSSLGLKDLPVALVPMVPMALLAVPAPTVTLEDPVLTVLLAALVPTTLPVSAR